MNGINNSQEILSQVLPVIKSQSQKKSIMESFKAKNSINFTSFMMKSKYSQADAISVYSAQKEKVQASSQLLDVKQRIHLLIRKQNEVSNHNIRVKMINDKLSLVKQLNEQQQKLEEQMKDQKAREEHRKKNFVKSIKVQIQENLKAAKSNMIQQQKQNNEKLMKKIEQLRLTKTKQNSSFIFQSKERVRSITRNLNEASEKVQKFQIEKRNQVIADKIQRIRSLERDELEIQRQREGLKKIEKLLQTQIKSAKVLQPKFQNAHLDLVKPVQIHNYEEFKQINESREGTFKLTQNFGQSYEMSPQDSNRYKDLNLTSPDQPKFSFLSEDDDNNSLGQTQSDYQSPQSPKSPHSPKSPTYNSPDKIILKPLDLSQNLQATQHNNSAQFFYSNNTAAAGGGGGVDKNNNDKLFNATYDNQNPVKAQTERSMVNDHQMNNDVEGIQEYKFYPYSSKDTIFQQYKQLNSSNSPSPPHQAGDTNKKEKKVRIANFVIEKHY